MWAGVTYMNVIYKCKYLPFMAHTKVGYNQANMQHGYLYEYALKTMGIFDWQMNYRVAKFKKFHLPSQTFPCLSRKKPSNLKLTNCIMQMHCLHYFCQANTPLWHTWSAFAKQIKKSATLLHIIFHGFMLHTWRGALLLWQILLPTKLKHV